MSSPEAPAAQLAAPAATPTGAAATPCPFMRLPALLVPDNRLLRYYALQSLLFGPFFFFALIPLYFRYRSLRYAIDVEGITMRWGVLFRREVSLTYARIQDIHLTSNVVERWLGLARIQVQTASGSAAAEMTIEGVPDVEVMRDFLYERMRGAGDRPRGMDAAGRADESVRQARAAATGALNTERIAAPALAGDAEALTAALLDVAAELRAVREQLERESATRRDG